MVDPVMLKIPAHVAAMLAEYIAYTPPNPPPKKEETTKYNGGDLISYIAAAASRLALAFAWSIHGFEIAALLARDARTPAASAVLAFLFKRPSDVRRLSLDKTFLLGLSSLIFGAALRKTCYITLGRHFTFQLALLKEHRLVTAGPYSYVRHPSYTGMVASVGGMLVAQLAPGGWIRESGVLETKRGKAVVGTWTLWLTWLIVAMLRRVPKEDEVLRREFGAQWEEWASRVRYALVPYVY
ncbi:ICMT-domain-containing protein [Trametes cingulata]|nr:ICMT-domain-containing protein [Trametes cingulata]